MKEAEDEKCPWCSVRLQESGSCPNPAHPSVCPFCGVELKNVQPLSCPKTFCASNAVRPTRLHSSFPPPVSKGVRVSPEMVQRDLRLYGLLLHARFPECGSVLQEASEEEDPTNPAIPVLHPSLLPSARCGESPPSTKREGSRSGVYPSVYTLKDPISTKAGSRGR